MRRRCCCVLAINLTLAALVGAQTPATIQGEAIYPKPAAEVWHQAKALLQDLKFRTEKDDKNNQVFVTQWRNYDPAVLPDVGTLGLDPRDRVKNMQLHLTVSPDHEPARIAVGSIVELERREASRTTSVMGYRVRAIEDWFLVKLDERMGAKHEPLAKDFNARVEQATRLGGSTKPCTVPERRAGAKPTAPVRISEVRPIFPAEGYSSGPKVINVQGVVTEHGTLIDLTIADASPQFAHFQSSARGAASLWRFRPSVYEGCPIVVFLTVRVNYTLR